MSQSIPINPSFGKAKAPWDPGGHNRGPIMCPPDIGDIAPVSKEKLSPRNRDGNHVMKAGKR